MLFQPSPAVRHLRAFDFYVSIDVLDRKWRIGNRRSSVRWLNRIGKTDADFAGRRGQIVELPIAPDLVVVSVGRQDTADPGDTVGMRTEAIALNIGDGAGSIGAGKVGDHRQIADRRTLRPHHRGKKNQQERTESHVRLHKVLLSDK